MPAAPRSASRRAVASPSPWVLPVISAILPVNWLELPIYVLVRRGVAGEHGLREIEGIRQLSKAHNTTNSIDLGRMIVDLITLLVMEEFFALF